MLGLPILVEGAVFSQHKNTVKHGTKKIRAISKGPRTQIIGF